MAMLARFAFLSLAALLAACSSHAPAPAPVVKPKVIFNQQGSSSPMAEDVLFRRDRPGRHAVSLGRQHAGFGVRLQWPDRLRLSGRRRDQPAAFDPRDDRHAGAQCGHQRPAVRRSGVLRHQRRVAGQPRRDLRGEGRFVHAPSTGGTVRLDYLSNSYWSRAYLQAKRVLPTGHLAQNP